MKKNASPVELEKTTMLICEHDENVPLTKGKTYEEIPGADFNKVFVIDDDGKKRSYYKSRFNK